MELKLLKKIKFVHVINYVKVCEAFPRRPNVKLVSHRCMCGTTRLNQSVNILLRTVLFIILLSCLRNDIVILDTLIVFTYLLISGTRDQ